MIPPFLAGGFIKLIIIAAVLAIIAGAYKMIDDFIDQARADRDAYIASEIDSAQKASQIQYMERAAALEREFQDDKAAIIQAYQDRRADDLDEYADRIERMGNADKMARVSELDNGFSKGSERLTFRAQRATDEISKELEDISAHDSLYQGMDPISGPMP